MVNSPRGSLSFPLQLQIELTWFCWGGFLSCANWFSLHWFILIREPDRFYFFILLFTIVEIELVVLSVNDSIWKWYRGLNDDIVLWAKSHNVAYHAYHTQIQNTERKLNRQNFESYTCDTLYFLLNWQKSCCLKLFFQALLRQKCLPRIWNEHSGHILRQHITVL